MGARFKETTAWLSPPHDASIFGTTVKAKIRCGSGGVKADLMEDDVTAIIRSPEDDVTPGYGFHMNDKPEIFSVRRVED